MTWVLFLAAFALGFGTCGLFVWFAQSRNLPGPGQHTGPMLIADEKPSHPRFGELIETPAEGIEAVRPDGMIRVGAHERNVQRKRTDDHAPWLTQSFPAIPDADAQYAAWAQRMAEEKAQQDRVDWIKSQLPENEDDVTREDMERVLASLRAMPVHGEKPVATVLAAQAEAEAAA